MRIFGRDLPFSRLDAVCLAGLLVSLVYPLALSPITPWLLATHPILLEALVGNTVSLVTAGAFARVGRTPLWLAILAPVVAGDALDPFSWWTGRRFGPRIPRTGRWGESYAPLMAKAERLFQRWGPWTIVLSYYLPVPNVIIFLLAGEAGMPLVVFVLLDLIGATLAVLPFVLLGFVLGPEAIRVADTITHYAGLSAIVLVVGMVAYSSWIRPWLTGHFAHLRRGAARS